MISFSDSYHHEVHKYGCIDRNDSTSGPEVLITIPSQASRVRIEVTSNSIGHTESGPFCTNSTWDTIYKWDGRPGTVLLRLSYQDTNNILYTFICGNPSCPEGPCPGGWWCAPCSAGHQSCAGRPSDCFGTCEFVPRQDGNQVLEFKVVYHWLIHYCAPCGDGDVFGGYEDLFLSGSIQIRAYCLQENQPPVASFTYSPQDPMMDEEIAFDASSSYDPDGEIVGHSWDFDASDGIQADAEGEVVTHAYCEAAGYAVTLLVTDDDGLTDSIVKGVEVLSPEVKFLDKDDRQREVVGATADGESKVIIQIRPLPLDMTTDDVGVQIASEEDGHLEDDATIQGGVFTQTYTAPKHFVRDGYPGHLTQGEREIALRIEINGTEIEHDPLYLSKAPVILLHGLWSNSACWSELCYDLRQHGFKYAFSWPYANSVHFEDNNGVVRNAVQASLKLASNDGFVAKKADVVCHSMGGLIAKLYGDASYIRSIATVGTPHYGSPLADMLCQMVGCGLPDEELNFIQYAVA